MIFRRKLVTPKCVRDHRQRSHRIAVDQHVRALPTCRCKTSQVEQRDEVIGCRNGKREVVVFLEARQLDRHSGHDLRRRVVEAVRPVEPTVRVGSSRCGGGCGRRCRYR